MSKIRKWKISWFVENAKTKEVLESVNCDDYIDRQTEKYDVLDKILSLIHISEPTRPY